MKRHAVYVTDADWKALKAKLALMGSTISAWFREMIRQFLQEKPTNKKEE